MPDPVPTAQSKIVGAFAELLEGYAPLAGISVFTDRSPEDAVQDEEMPCIVIFCQAWAFDNTDWSQGQTTHKMTLNFEFIGTSEVIGIVNQKAQEVLAYVLMAIGDDPTLGGRLEDFEEIDVAPPGDNGKSVGGSSLQGICTFYTPRRNHFVIVGQGGDEF